MSFAVEGALMGAACLAAFAGGALAVRDMGAWRRAARRRRARERSLEGSLPLEGRGAIERAVVRYAMKLGDPSTGPAARSGFGARAAAKSARDAEELIKRAGLEGRVSETGLHAARLRLAGIGGAAALLLGSAISLELGVLLGLAAAAMGFALPRLVLRRLEGERARELERGLPEMLEVLALGLRSGLSFDRSFQLYSAHFPSSFAHACALAQKSWTLGLRSRDEALRELARSYRSDQLAHAVERIVRSLRFGSALAPDLEAAAAEARARRRSLVEERIAKAPVKMMVPTGALILPAMLILILGPILLELMQG